MKLRSVAVALGCLFLSAFAKGGGISDGGGKVTSTPPVSVREVVELIRGSHASIRQWLNLEEFYYFLSHNTPIGSLPNPSLGDKLFGGERTIFDVLDRLSIEVRTKSSCRDLLGRPVDGSVLKKTDTICISAWRIAKKLNRRNYGPETRALILHEASHLVGGREKEVQHYQYRAVDVFTGVDVDDLAWRLTMEFLSTASNLERALTTIKTDPRGQCSKLTALTKDYSRLQWGLYSEMSDWPGLRAVDQDRLVAGWVQLSALQDFVCGNDVLSDSEDERERFKLRYTKGFADSMQISVSDYLVNRTQPSPVPRLVLAFEPLVIQRIKTNEDVLREANSVRMLMAKTVTDLESLSSIRIKVVERH
jgi:hypothetical protein